MPCPCMQLLEVSLQKVPVDYGAHICYPTIIILCQMSVYLYLNPAASSCKRITLYIVPADSE